MHRSPLRFDPGCSTPSFPPSLRWCVPIASRSGARTSRACSRRWPARRRATDQPFSWEGLDYTVDPMAGEHERIIRIREQLPTPGLDAALESRDPDALVTALRAMVYAPALGDPEGAVTLSPDVVTRHDFGGTRSPSGRNLAWLPAVERTGTGGPWHVGGSLLGLDLALGRSALRRLSADEMPAVPTINLNDQLTLARTAVALATARFDDAARDELAAAIARGRQRVAEAGASAPALLALGEEVGMTAADTPGAAVDAGVDARGRPAALQPAGFDVARPPAARARGAGPLGGDQRAGGRAARHPIRSRRCRGITSPVVPIRACWPRRCPISRSGWRRLRPRSACRRHSSLRCCCSPHRITGTRWKRASRTTGRPWREARSALPARAGRGLHRGAWQWRSAPTALTLSSLSGCAQPRSPKRGPAGSCDGVPFRLSCGVRIALSGRP